jgi:pimeloyl-ACP methyl ester carboxylesterase
MIGTHDPMPGHYDPRISIRGDGTPVVLVPGMDGTGLLFYRQVPLLARSYRVATYRLRDAAGNMETLMDDLSAVIETVAPAEGRVILVGESFGGTLAMSLALARPEQVLALVVLNSFPYFAPQVRLRIARTGLRVLPWGAMSLIRRLTASRLHSSHSHADEIQRFLTLTAKTTREGYLNRLSLLTSYDVRDRLRDLQVPVLFVAADQDHLVPSVAQAREMAARAPHAHVQVLTGQGHICLIAPDVDLEQILSDWRRTPA